MAARRSRPMMIAPLIPLWGILAFLGDQQFAGTRFFVPFLAIMAVIFIALFGYVARAAWRSRQLRASRGRSTQ